MYKNIFLLFCFALLFLIFPTQKASAAGAGDVVINEFMADPAGADSDKEWIEVKNVSGGELSLENWTVNDGSNHPVSGNYLIPNGGLAVICRNIDPLQNGGISCHYGANIVFANSGDTIVLYDNDYNLIDSVTYLDGDTEEGKSRYFDGLEWVNDSVNLYNESNYGTPGYSVDNIGSEEFGTFNALVLLTILNPDVLLSGETANVSFNINDDSDIVIEYGESDLYGNNISESVLAGDVSIDIAGLECDKTYHYKITANNGEQSVETEDAVFSVTCAAIEINSLTMTKGEAKANDNYNDGWQWVFDITVWDKTEDRLQMKFDEWTNSVDTLSSAGNIRFSVDGGSTWINITADASYSALVDIVDLDLDSAGTQVEILVEMKVPNGTLAREYSSQYGIRTE